MIFTAGPAILDLYFPALIISDFAFYYFNIAQLLYYLLYFSKNILVFSIREINKNKLICRKIQHGQNGWKC